MSGDTRLADAAAVLVRGCLIGIVLLPLAVAPTLLIYPYVTAKGLALHGLAALMLLALALRSAAGRPTAIATDWTFRTFALVVLVGAISGVLGSDPTRSLWDSLERMAGTLTIGCAFVVFVAARHVVRAEAERLRWLAGAALVAVPVAVVAVLQARGVDVLGLPLQDRPTSTLGHPAYVGAMGLFAAFVGALVMSATRRPALRVAGAVGAAAGVVCVVAGEARSALLALVLGAVAILILRAVRGRAGGRERRALQWATSACLLAAAAVVLLVKSPWARDIPVVRRLVGISWESHTIATRLLVWDASIDAWLERPVLGWGACGFERAFEGHYAPGLLRFTLPETWFDDAHNLLMNTLVEQGAIGGLALIVFAGVLLQTTWNGPASTRDTPWAAAIPFGFVVAHFTDKLFVFEGIVSWVQLALFLALALPSTAPEPTPNTDRVRGHRWTAVPAAAVAVWLLAVSVVPQGLGVLRGRRAMALLIEGSPTASDVLDDALRPAPQHAAEISRIYCALAARELPRVARAAGAEPAIDMGRHALTRQRSAARDGVRDTVVRASLGLALPGLCGDPEILDALGDDLEVAALRAPRRQEIVFLQADVARLNGDALRAAELLTEVRDRDPSLSEPWLRLIVLYGDAGKRVRAKRLVQQAEQSGIRFDAAQRRRLDACLR